MVSKYLAEMARNLDYSITVCDPRQQMLDDFGVSGVRLTAEMPDDAVREFANDPASAIVALTHDPRIDDMGLMEALKTQAFYVGAMGSKKTSANRRERLKALDLTDAEIDRLHAPIGIAIGSKTPPEIAISILAEITAVRSGAAASKSSAALTQAVS
jgi:xanthine dehydrogenase accessory factor